jgi:hypothetical protein
VALGLSPSTHHTQGLHLQTTTLAFLPMSVSGELW